MTGEKVCRYLIAVFIGVIEIIALLKGIDGVALGVVSGVMGGLVGYDLGLFRKTKQNKEVIDNQVAIMKDLQDLKRSQ